MDGTRTYTVLIYAGLYRHRDPIVCYISACMNVGASHVRPHRVMCMEREGEGKEKESRREGRGNRDMGECAPRTQRVERRGRVATQRDVVIAEENGRTIRIVEPAQTMSRGA